MSPKSVLSFVFALCLCSFSLFAQDTSDLYRHPEKERVGLQAIPDEYILSLDPRHPDTNLNFVIISLKGNNLREGAQKKETTNFLNVIFPYFRIQPADLKSISPSRMVIHLDSAGLNGAKKDFRFKRIERNYMVTSPYGKESGFLAKPLFNQEIVDWGVQSVVSVVHKNIDSKKKVYIIDSGVDKDHEDLNVDQADCLSFIPDVPYYAVSGFRDYHGTHVAGIIGAKNNGKGIIGVAPNASIIAYKVIQNGVIPAIYYYLDALDSVLATGREGDVLNLSIENTPGDSTEIETIQAIGRKGIVVVISAGNSGKNVFDPTVFPAAISGVNIYTIASNERDDSFSTFSNYGQPDIAYLAPGNSIYSTLPGNTYGQLTGTSQSAPHVAGLFLLENTIHQSGITKCPSDRKQYARAHE